LKEDVLYFRVGLFVVLGALLLVGGLVLFGAGRVFQPRVMVETYVDGSVQGIDVGSAVKFRGVTIGKVSHIGFTSIEYPEQVTGTIFNYVVVVMELTHPVFPDMFSDRFAAAAESAVTAGLRARIEPQGITGMSYIEMDYTNPQESPPLPLNWKPNYFYVPSAPGQLASILDSINKITTDVEHLNLAGIGEKTMELLTNMNQAVESADFASLSRDARKLFNDLDHAIDQADFPSMAQEARAAMAKISRATEDLKVILTNLEPATRLNSDDIDATLSNLRIISDNLRVVTGDARRYPSRLIFGGPPEPTEVMPVEEPTGPGRRRTR